MLDPVMLNLVATAVASGAAGKSQEAWARALADLKKGFKEETPGSDNGVKGDGIGEPSAEGNGAASRLITSAEPLSELLRDYYKKVGRRADISFFAAIVAAVLGYVVIAIGVTIGVYNGDDMALGVTTTGAGIFSQVLAFFFFRNRREERRMMVDALADLRKDARADTRILRSIELLEQISDSFMRDSLMVAISLELSGASADLNGIHKLVDRTDSKPTSTTTPA